MFRKEQIEVADLILQTLMEHEKKFDGLCFALEGLIDELTITLAQIPTNPK